MPEQQVPETKEGKEDNESNQKEGAEAGGADAAAPAPTHATTKDGSIQVAVASRLSLYEVMKPIGTPCWCCLAVACVLGYGL